MSLSHNSQRLSVIATVASLSLASLVAPSAHAEQNPNSPAPAAKGPGPRDIQNAKVPPELLKALEATPIARASGEESAAAHKSIVEAEKKLSIEGFRVSKMESGFWACDRYCLEILNGNYPNVLQIPPQEVAEVLANVLRTAKLVDRGVAAIDYLLKNSVADPKLNTIRIETLGKLCVESRAAKNLLLQVALYLPDDVVAFRACEVLSEGHPAIREWLGSERDVLRAIREGRSLATAEHSGRLAVLIEDLERISSITIPLLEKKITEQADQIKQLTKDNEETAKRAKELAEEVARAEREKAEQQRIYNATRRVDGIDLVRLDGYGAARGNETEDLIPVGARIIGVGYRAGSRIDAIWLIYEKDGKVSETPHRGGNGGTEGRIDLDNDEFIRFFGHRGNDRDMSHLMVYTSRSGTGRVIGNQRSEPAQRLARGLDGVELTREQRKDEGCNVVCVGIRVRADNEIRCIAPVVQIKPE